MQDGVSMGRGGFEETLRAEKLLDLKPLGVLQLNLAWGHVGAPWNQEFAEVVYKLIHAHANTLVHALAHATPAYANPNPKNKVYRKEFPNEMMILSLPLVFHFCRF